MCYVDASSENDGAYKYTSKCFVVKAKDYSYEMSDILSLYAFASCFHFSAKSVCSHLFTQVNNAFV